MDGIGRTIRRQAGQAREAERFVWLVVGGGIALVAGLWVARLTTRWSPAWTAGLGLCVLGVAGLAAGIVREIDW